jgi:4-amino-4-deoxy-L-arabinose transferase-like glycosyltransferase
MVKILNYKKEILAAVFIVIAYFFSRLIFLGDFPIFTDEAIYTRWTQIALNDASWRFISLTDGKQPSFIWAGMVFLKIFQDPLFSLRLVSVIAGFFTLIGLGVLTYELFKNKFAAYLASFIYLVLPFALVYDRLALYDSLLGAFTIWGIYLSALLARRVRLDIAFFLGFVMGRSTSYKKLRNISYLSSSVYTSFV